MGVDFGPREGLRSLETQAAVPGGGWPSELRKAHTGLFGAGATWPEVGILCDLSCEGLFRKGQTLLFVSGQFPALGLL